MTQDYTTAMKDMLGALPMDTSSFENLFKSQTALAEKMSAVAIEAAQRSTDLTARWTQDTLAKLSDASKAKAEPTEYAKSATDFMTASAESVAEHMAAFAEIAKKVQTDTMELLLAAGKDMGEDMTRATQRATSEAGAAVRKATATATNV